MHKYMRAIGFSNFKDRKELQKLITNVIIEGTERNYTSNGKETLLAEFCKDFGTSIGIAVCGEFDNEDKFTYDYYFPYLRGMNISSEEDVSLERHAAQESYAGVCDDVRMGVSIIFYLQNMIPYVKAKNSGTLPIRGTTLTLSALSLKGTIMMAINKSEKDLMKNKQVSMNRSQLLNAARKGDENAIESLTLDDMDTYTAISKRIQKEDVFSLVDTYFMPYGVECDQYSILGEILDCSLIKNGLTEEDVYLMTINCNDMIFDLCINKEDVYGEPGVGRRFKGTIWMQGYINFPN
ncbi:DUF3881 family protein [Parablautia intestinalis]|uniref:DUF3881 family protein n=1 Tax=Parablautia intestinalis TaxID=2320100 RepID=A0A3A9AK89_9FIRM|nr:DUF3881 family protein [Parablautia intestinalis]MCI8615198.1 DUF3881 family protein [Lachnospiraceae bacterium]RKI92000.1 DUF3881 family protein [Parablautia intestinalis]